MEQLSFLPDGFTEIPSNEALNFLLPRHYLGRGCSISRAFGVYEGGTLKAVCTFGVPASVPLVEQLCGKKWRDHILELNRLCRTDDYDEPLSKFVAWCLKQLKDNDIIVVSFADSEAHHHGYIYQATNFFYTGETDVKYDIYTGGHPRTYTQEQRESGLRTLRSMKYRYVYFCTHNKKLKKEWMQSLKYPIQPYPKGDNQNYVLGTVMQKQVYKQLGKGKYEEVRKEEHNGSVQTDT